MTPKERAAIQQALEALEEIHVGNMTPMAEENWKKAITALRESIEHHKPHDECECNACLNYCTDRAHEEALAEQAEQEPVKLIYEDELPEDYPYDEMFSRSIIIEGVRMFPEVQTEHSVVNESLTAEDSQIPAFLRRAGSFGD